MSLSEWKSLLLHLEMSTDVICQLAYDGKLEELQTKLKTDFKLASKKFQVSGLYLHFYSLENIK